MIPANRECLGLRSISKIGSALNTVGTLTYGLLTVQLDVHVTATSNGS